jgi:hypothetical protein
MLEVGYVQGRRHDGESRPTWQWFTAASSALAVSAHPLLIQPDSSDADQFTSSIVLGITQASVLKFVVLSEVEKFSSILVSHTAIPHAFLREDSLPTKCDLITTRCSFK